jgi:hypothetical protein
MEDGLKFWKCKTWLNAHEAANLIIGNDPIDGLDEEPRGWRPIYDELIDALNRYCYVKENLTGRNDLGPYEGIFKSDNISGYTEEGNHVSTFGIRQTAIPEWLNACGVESEYFSSLDKQNKRFVIPPPESEYFSWPDNPDKIDVIARPEYQTKLMAIMYATIERYYGENYDPNDSDTAPKQTDVIGWIRKKYSLSEAKAKAVEKMTRPD